MDSIFKKTLRSELDFQDVKVKELAFKTGLSKRTLEGYLGARASIPPADVAVKIAGALNVSVEYLVTGRKFFEKPVSEQDQRIIEEIGMLSKGQKELLAQFITSLKEFKIQKE